MKIRLFLILIQFINFLKCENLKCSIANDYRVDCFPETWSKKEDCEKRGCCWKSPDQTNATNVPYCFYPSNYIGYTVSESKLNSSTDKDYLGGLILKRIQPSGFPNDINEISITLKAINKYRASIKVEPVNKKRWIPPIQLDLDHEPTTEDQRLYKLVFDLTFVKVVRKSTNQEIWKMNYQNLIFSDQWLQAETHLSSLTLFGLGEHKDTYRKKFSEQRTSFLSFSQGYPPIENAPLYSSHPMYLAYESSSNSTSSNQKVFAHTILFLNSNAVEAVLSQGKILVWRSIGGQLDFYFNLGSDPQDAVSKYISLVGRPPLPPYWALGFHLCKYGYNNLDKMRKVYNRMKENLIPLDVMWNDIDVFKDYNIFTYSNKSESFLGLPEFIDELHDENRHYMVMLDPGLGGNYSEEEYPALYDGIKKNAFIKTAKNKNLRTKVWNKYFTLWVDFTSENATDFWEEQIAKFHSEIEFDGLWIDMNSPDANGVDGSLDGCDWSDKYETPYFIPNGIRGQLTKDTACMNAKHAIGRHYDIHNMYSYFESIATNLALKRLKKRPFIISRSSFVGHGRFASKWSGDVLSSWIDLRISISNLISFNIYGVPVNGADICGFLGDTDPELCARWQSVGAFYTFSRNHNDINSKDQDPPSLGQVVVEASKYSLNIRYSLLPLLYTELFLASQDGRPVAKALSLVFPNDKNTYDIENQFLWGDSLMIVPILEQGKTKIDAYLPAGIWYDFVKQKIVSKSIKGKYLEMNIPIDRIGVLLHGGNILFTQKPALTTTETRKSSFDVIVALDENHKAEGNLYWDDGLDFQIEKTKSYNFVNFHAYKNALFNKIIRFKFRKQPFARSISVLGVNFKVTKVTINGRDAQFNYDITNSRLLINENLDLTNQFIVVWY